MDFSLVQFEPQTDEDLLWWFQKSPEEVHGGGHLPLRTQDLLHWSPRQDFTGANCQLSSVALGNRAELPHQLADHPKSGKAVIWYRPHNGLTLRHFYLCARAHFLRVTSCGGTDTV